MKDYKQYEAAIETQSRKSNRANGESQSKHVVGGSIQTTIEKIKVTKKESDPSSSKAKRDPRIISKSPALGRRSDSKRLGTGTSGGPLNIKKLTLQDQKNNRNSINRQQESRS